MGKICSNCDAKNPDEAKFCRKCGSQNFEQSKTVNLSQEDINPSTQISDITHEELETTTVSYNNIENHILEKQSSNIRQAIMNIVIYSTIIVQILLIISELNTFIHPEMSEVISSNYSEEFTSFTKVTIFSTIYTVPLFILLTIFIHHIANNASTKKIAYLYICALPIIVAVRLYLLNFYDYHVKISALILLFAILMFFIIQTYEYKKQKNSSTIAASLVFSLLPVIYFIYQYIVLIK